MEHVCATGAHMMFEFYRKVLKRVFGSGELKYCRPDELLYQAKAFSCSSICFRPNLVAAL